VKHLVLLVFLAALGLLPACAANNGSSGGDDTDTGTDTDTDTDTSTDTDTESDTDTGDPIDPGSMCPGYPDTTQSFIWIANSREGTLSKVCTTSATEVARYLTSAYGDLNDPSRTSVNLHGDVVVSNRREGYMPWGEGESSVTKFAADVAECTLDMDTCVWNGEESKCAQCVETCDVCDPTCTVLAWENDGCMLWNAELTGNEGARATAWDGLEDPETGEGGHVWMGTSGGAHIHKIDGDTGEVLEEALVQSDSDVMEVAYGGVMDGAGNLWITDWPVGQRVIWRWDMGTMSGQEYWVECAYGIAIDGLGRIWTSGRGVEVENGISIFEPGTENVLTVDASETGSTYLRGIAAGVPGTPSEGYMWTVDTYGMLLKVDMETALIVETSLVGDESCDGSGTGAHSTIGVAVDFEGYVWVVSYCLDRAYKVDPVTFDRVEVPIGDGPYTYSDMTGMQLKIVVDPE
jgi:streptogramin lyase